MFFSDKNIYKINSERGGSYRVFDSKLGRYLTLNQKFIGAHKSYKAKKKTYFYDIVSEIEEKKPGVKNALVFGMGAFTIQNILIESFEKIKITTIESDHTLLDINEYFFDLQKNKNSRIVVSDAFQFVKNSENIYDFHNKCDLVIVDFNLLGSHFYSEIFIKETKNFLTNSGLFVAIFERKNLLHNTDIIKYVQRISLYYNKITLVYSKDKILGVLCSDN
jgi:spermidine synthase